MDKVTQKCDGSLKGFLQTTQNSTIDRPNVSAYVRKFRYGRKSTVISSGLLSATLSVFNAFPISYIVLLHIRILVGTTVMPPMIIGLVLGEVK